MYRLIIAILLSTIALPAIADQAYVTDKLILGLYAQPNNTADRLTLLHSGDKLDVLGASKGWTQVRTSEGTIGWAKSSYLVKKPTASLQLAAAQSRVTALTQELDKTRQTLRAARSTPVAQQLTAAEKNVTAITAERDRLLQQLHNAQATQQETEAKLSSLKSQLAREQTGPGFRVIGLSTLALLLILFLTFRSGVSWNNRRVRRRLGGLDL